MLFGFIMAMHAGFKLFVLHSFYNALDTFIAV